MKHVINAASLFVFALGLLCLYQWYTHTNPTASPSTAALLFLSAGVISVVGKRDL